jgi:hypothetical protein
MDVGGRYRPLVRCEKGNIIGRVVFTQPNPVIEILPENGSGRPFQSFSNVAHRFAAHHLQKIVTLRPQVSVFITATEF